MRRAGGSVKSREKTVAKILDFRAGISAELSANNIVVLRETLAGEARVALMPDSLAKLSALGANVRVEKGAGLGASRTDQM